MKIKKREDSKRGTSQYKTGEKVLMHWPLFRLYADVFRKHRLRYVGPFTVVKIVGENAVELEGLPERMPKVINTEYLHPYIQDDSSMLHTLRHSPPPPQPQRDVRAMTMASPSSGGAVLRSEGGRVGVRQRHNVYRRIMRECGRMMSSCLVQNE